MLCVMFSILFASSVIRRYISKKILLIDITSFEWLQLSKMWVDRNDTAPPTSNYSKCVLYLVRCVSDDHQHLLQSRLESAADAHKIIFILQPSSDSKQQGIDHLMGHFKALVGFHLPGPQIWVFCPGLAALVTFCCMTWHCWRKTAQQI